MADEYERTSLEISSPAQFKAMGHPLRQRLLFLLGEAATVSQLAARLDMAKGTVSYHLKVLRDAGMVAVVERRTVRGGTEEYYRRAAARLDIAPKTPGFPESLLQGFSEEFLAAEDEPLLILRHVRLSAAQAARLREVLQETAEELELGSEPDPRFGLLIGMYRERAS
jgi:DNA-binding transcriptional ArsR family regulator